MARPFRPRTPLDEQYGIILGVYPSTDQTLSVELQRSDTGTTWAAFGFNSPRSGGAAYVVRDPLPLDGLVRSYRARSFGPGWAPSGWSETVAATPTLLPETNPPLETINRRKTEVIVYTGGEVYSRVTQQTSAGSQAYVTGQQSGSVNGGAASTGAWADGPAVTFPQAYPVVPAVRLYPGSNTVYDEPDGTAWSNGLTSTARRYIELTAVNITKTGFTPRARLVQRGAGTPTARTHNWTGATLANGESTSLTLANAPAFNDQYAIGYDVDLSLNDLGVFTVTAVVAVDVATGSSTTFTERNTQSYSRQLGTTYSTYSWSGETLTAVAAGVPSTGLIRIRFKSLSVKGGTTASVDATIDPSTTVGVTYVTSTATVSYAAMCPSTADAVQWVAQMTQATT